MQIVIRSGKVIVAHDDNQNLNGKYSGAEVLRVTDALGRKCLPRAIEKTEDDGRKTRTVEQQPDPRTVPGLYTLADVRAQRDALLSASDHTQLTDSPLSDDIKTAWAAYRQALRDIPETATTAAAIVWPAKPGA